MPNRFLSVMVLAVVVCALLMFGFVAFVMFDGGVR